MPEVPELTVRFRVRAAPFSYAFRKRTSSQAPRPCSRIPGTPDPRFRSTVGRVPPSSHSNRPPTTWQNRRIFRKIRRFVTPRPVWEISAESEGFEPPEPCGSTVFKTAAIDHSANFPGTKVASIFHSAKSLPGFSHHRGFPEMKIPAEFFTLFKICLSLSTS